jgi:hypothetical protein
MHLTFLQKMPDDPEPVVLTSDPAPVVPAAVAPEPPKFWMDLAGIRLLELRYLARVSSAIESDGHYRAFLRILHLAYHNRVYYVYDPDYYWDGNRGDRRFGEWRVQDEKRKVTPYVIPYLEQLDLSGSEPRVIYYDFFKSKEARKKAGKATELDLMQEQHEDVDVPINMEEMHRAFTGQWENKDDVAYKKLREMKADAILRLSNSGSIRAQMLDLDWWEYRDQLCNAQLDPALGREFRDVLSEAVQLEEQ